MADRMRDELKEPDKQETPAPILTVGVIALVIALAVAVWLVLDAV